MNNEEKTLSLLEGLVTSVARIQTDVAQIQTEQAKTNLRLDNLEQGQDELKQGQTDLKRNLAELLTYTLSIHQLVNEDYALLQSLDKKVDSLANISQAHEEKFQKLRAL